MLNLNENFVKIKIEKKNQLDIGFISFIIPSKCHRNRNTNELMPLTEALNAHGHHKNASLHSYIVSQWIVYHRISCKVICLLLSRYATCKCERVCVCVCAVCVCVITTNISAKTLHTTNFCWHSFHMHACAQAHSHKVSNVLVSSFHLRTSIRLARTPLWLSFWLFVWLNVQFFTVIHRRMTYSSSLSYTQE